MAEDTRSATCGTNRGGKGQGRTPPSLPRETLTTDRLILCRREPGLHLPTAENEDAEPGRLPRYQHQLGSRFCGNGDLVTFALNTTRSKDGEQVPRLIDAGYGPVIHEPHPLRGSGGRRRGRGFYIEDAGYPNFVNWIMETVEVPGEAIRQFWGGIAGRLLDKLLSREPETDIGSEVSRLLGSTEFTADLLPLLGMGRDVPDGG